MPIARIASGLLAASLTMVMLWVGLPLLAPAYLILTGIAIQEYAAMLNLRGIPVRRRSLWTFTALTLPASLPPEHPWMVAWGIGDLPWRDLLLVAFVLYLFVAEVITSNRSSLNTTAFTLFGYVWISWGFGLVITMRYIPDGVTGLWYLAFPVLAIVATDVGGYVFGSLWGRHPLAPRISPKKTVEGAVGGILLAFVLVSLTMWLMPRWTDFRLDLAHLLIFGLAVPLAALAGDLFESLVKRWVGVKDAGVFMPGHGGVLDRIDSFLLAMPVTYLLITVVLR